MTGFDHVTMCAPPPLLQARPVPPPSKKMKQLFWDVVPAGRLAGEKHTPHFSQTCSRSSSGMWCLRDDWQVKIESHTSAVPVFRVQLPVA